MKNSSNRMYRFLLAALLPTLLFLQTGDAANLPPGTVIELEINGVPLVHGKSVRVIKNTLSSDTDQIAISVNNELPEGGTWSVKQDGAVVPGTSMANDKLSFTRPTLPGCYTIEIVYELDNVTCVWYMEYYVGRPVSTQNYMVSYVEDTIKNPDVTGSCDNSELDYCICPDPKKNPGTTSNSSQDGSYVLTPLGSFDFSAPLALFPNEPDLDLGRVRNYQYDPEDNPADPKQLYYASVATMKILNTRNIGGSKRYTIQQASGFYIEFVKNPFLAAGKPVGQDHSSNARVQYVNLNGDPVNLVGAAYLRQYRASGGYVDFDLNSGEIVRYITRSGRETTFPNSDFDIREVNGVLRTVKTAAGAINIRVLSERSYQVDTYQSWQIGDGATGLGYTFSGDPIRSQIISSPEGSKGIIVETIQGGRSETVRFGYNGNPVNENLEDFPTIVSPGETNEGTDDDYSIRPFGHSREDQEKVSSWIQEVLDGDDLVMTRQKSNKVLPDGDELVTTTWRDSGSNQFYSSGTVMKKMPWGGVQPISSESFETSITSEGPITRTMSYYVIPSELGYGRLKSHTHSTGNVISYEYDNLGRMTRRTSAYLDDSQGKVEIFDYTPLGPGETLDDGDFRPRTVTVTYGGQFVSRRYFSATYGVSGQYTEVVEMASGPNANFGASSNLRTTTEYFSPSTQDLADRGRVARMTSPDGVVTKFDYSSGNTYETDLQITVTGNLASGDSQVVGHSSRMTVILDNRGEARSQQSEVFAASADANGNPTTSGTWEVAQVITMEYDARGQKTSTTEVDGQSQRSRILESCTWNGGRIETKTDEQGITYRYGYDEFGRVNSVVREAIASSGVFEAQDEISVDIAGTPRRAGGAVGWQNEQSLITGGALTLNSSSVRDYRGRISSQTDVNGYTTSLVYNSSGTNVVKTSADGTSVTVNTHIDGRMDSMTGIGTVDGHFNYTALAGKFSVTKAALTENGIRKSTETYNSLGQLENVTIPSFGGLNDVGINYFYQSGKGLLERVSSTAVNTPDQIFQYNSVSVLTSKGASLDTTLSANSTDRLIDIQTGYIKNGSGVFSRAASSVYQTENSATQTLVGTALEQISGFGGNRVSRSLVTDIAGNTTESFTDLTRSSGLIESTTQLPEVTGDISSISFYGRMASAQTPGVTGITSYGYDGLGRMTTMKDPRHTGSMVTNYFPNSNLIQNGQDAAGNTTSYAYYGQGQLGAGRVKTATLANNTATNYAYTELGKMRAKWGSLTYPQYYEYDTYNQLSKLHTYKTVPSSLNVASVPATAPSGSAVTSWNYDPSTGLLSNKRYDDNFGPDYNYDNAGRLTERKWARLIGASNPDAQGNEQTQRVTSSYDYTVWGELDTVDYNDSLTLPLDFDYDRLGRLKKNAQGSPTLSRVHDFNYNPTNLLLSSTDITDNLFTNAPTFSRTIERKYDQFLRSDLVSLKDGATVENGTNYDYDSVGRIGVVALDNSGVAGAISAANQSQLGHAYSYDPKNYGLIKSVQSPAHLVENAYESNRDILLSKTNKVGTNVVSKYAYEVNEIGQRTKLTQSGSAFTGLPLDGNGDPIPEEINWSYDVHGQINTANYTNSPENNRDYNFDSIGNRTQVQEDTGTNQTTESYVSDSLNQYTNIAGNSRSHDKDGNLLSDDRFNYKWDAENRLIELKRTTDNALIAEYRYDFASRRVEKYTTGDAEGGVSYLAFTYDGWNLTSEHKVNSTEFDLARTYTWGKDLSGWTQGAGGVGGLLAIHVHEANTQTYYPTYDGNGNISEYIDSSGLTVAHYEYDTFGNTVSSYGSMLEYFSYRFSSKYFDSESSFLYYGYRFFNPTTGRWINRDPINELGGSNLYCLLDNDSIGNIDYLGLVGPLGCLTGMVTDYAIQVTTNYASGKRGTEAWTDVSPGSILVSGALGAVGVPGSALKGKKAYDAARRAKKLSDRIQKTKLPKRFDKLNPRHRKIFRRMNRKYDEIGNNMREIYESVAIILAVKFTKMTIERFENTIERLWERFSESRYRHICESSDATLTYEGETYIETIMDSQVVDITIATYTNIATKKIFQYSNGFVGREGETISKILDEAHLFDATSPSNMKAPMQFSPLNLSPSVNLP